MQAIELNAPLTANREIHLKLPNDVNAAYVKIIIMYENSTQPQPKKWDEFFTTPSVFADDFLAERDNMPPQEREFC